MTDPSPAERVVCRSVAPHKTLSITEHCALQSHSIARLSGQPFMLISGQQMQETAGMVCCSKRQLLLPPHQPRFDEHGHSEFYFSPKAKCQQPPAANFFNQLMPKLKAPGPATLADNTTNSQPATSAEASHKNPARNRDAWTAYSIKNTGGTDGRMGGDRDRDLAIGSAESAIYPGCLGHPVQHSSLSEQCEAENCKLAAEDGVPIFSATRFPLSRTSSQLLLSNQATAAMLPAHKLPHQAPALHIIYLQWFAQLFRHYCSHDQQQGLRTVLSIAFVIGVVICSFLLMDQNGVLKFFNPLGLESVATPHMVAKTQHLPATVRWGVNTDLSIFSSSWGIADNCTGWLEQQETHYRDTLNALKHTVFACLDVGLVWLRCCASLVSWYCPLVFRYASKAAQLRHGWANRPASGLSRVALAASSVGCVAAVVGTLMR